MYLPNTQRSLQFHKLKIPDCVIYGEAKNLWDFRNPGNPPKYTPGGTTLYQLEKSQLYDTTCKYS